MNKIIGLFCQARQAESSDATKVNENLNDRLLVILDDEKKDSILPVRLFNARRFLESSTTDDELDIGVELKTITDQSSRSF